MDKVLLLIVLAIVVLTIVISLILILKKKPADKGNKNSKSFRVVSSSRNLPPKPVHNKNMPPHQASKESYKDELYTAMFPHLSDYISTRGSSVANVLDKERMDKIVIECLNHFGKDKCDEIFINDKVHKLSPRDREWFIQMLEETMNQSIN